MVIASRSVPWTIINFGVAGMVSVFLVVVCGRIPSVDKWIPYSSVGVVFGVCLAVCFYIYLRVRAWWTSFFVAACVVAFNISVRVAFSTHLHALDFLRNNQWGPGPDAFFAAGAPGAFLVLTAAFLLVFPPQPLWLLLLKCTAWSLVGGALGVAGYKLNSSGSLLWLFAVWQTGMAVLLGLTLQIERRFSPFSSDHDAPLAATHRPAGALAAAQMLFVAAISVLLVYFVISEI